MQLPKVIIITGASSGFGYVLAKMLAGRGHRVYAGARRIEKMQSLIELGVHTSYLDVRDDGSVSEFVDRVLDVEGKIDILYNNAGYGLYGAIEDVSLEQVKDQFDTNVYGVVRMNNAVLPSMREQGLGRIIITCSVVSHSTTAYLGYYAATKHAVKAISMALRQEVMHLGIEVVQIEPGISDTEFGDIALPLLKQNTIHETYKPLMRQYYDLTIDLFKKASSTEKTAQVMMEAGLSSNPKWLYRTTTDSKIIAFLQKIIGEKAFDRLMHFAIRNIKK